MFYLHLVYFAFPIKAPITNVLIFEISLGKWNCYHECLLATRHVAHVTEDCYGTQYCLYKVTASVIISGNIVEIRGNSLAFKLYENL